MDMIALDTEKFKSQKEALELGSLLESLKERELTEASIKMFNEKVGELNALQADSDDMKKNKIKAVKNAILKHLEKQYKLVTPNYYATMWIPLGMTSFGLPIGTAIYVLTGNVAFLGIGLPIGMAFGSFYGASLDKKAAKENRVLNLQEQKG